VAERVDVAVVGGGIAGLAAAHALAKRRLSFVVLEASPRFGGVILTETRGGFLLEGGPDSILAQKPEGLALCRELGLGERLVPTNPRERAVYVLHRGALHPLPEGMMLAVPTRILPLLQSRLFTWPGKLRMGLDLVIPPRRGDDDESIASFLRRRFGQESVDRLGEPLLAGIHAGDPERLSIRATFPRFAELERRHGSLVRGLRAASPPVPASPSGMPPSAFYSLVGGLGELVETLVARLPGGSVRASSRVASLARRDDGFVLGVDGGGTIEAQAAIVAVPAPKAAPLLAPLLPEVARILSAIPFASSATVLLGYRRDQVRHPLDGYGMVVPVGEGLRSSACSFVSTKLPGRAPEGHVLLRGFLGGVRDPSVLDLGDDGLVETVRREMGPVLGLSGDPVLARVFRWPAGTPQLEVGHLERMRELECSLAAVPGLILTGSGLRGTGIPDTIADGQRAAASAAAVLADSRGSRPSLAHP
jgi:oxygen-dependent protoporphyrinogen oxidase